MFKKFFIRRLAESCINKELRINQREKDGGVVYYTFSNETIVEKYTIGDKVNIQINSIEGNPTSYLWLWDDEETTSFGFNLHLKNDIIFINFRFFPSRIPLSRYDILSFVFQNQTALSFIILDFQKTLINEDELFYDTSFSLSMNDLGKLLCEKTVGWSYSSQQNRPIQGSFDDMMRAHFNNLFQVFYKILDTENLKGFLK